MEQTAIELKPVNSLSIKGIGYDEATNTCAIQFSSGGTYHYRGVSPEAHKALVEAPSIGAHFHKHFKANYEGAKQAA